MTYDPTDSQIPVHSRQNTHRVWRKDSANARVPVSARDGEPASPIVVRTSYSSLGSGVGDFASAATDNTWITLPVGKFMVPSLRRVVLIRWEIVGDYSNPLGDAESIEAQLMVDGSAVDSALAYAQTAAVTSTGAIRFTADLVTVGTLTSPRFLMSTKCQIVDASAASIISTEKFMFSTIDSLANQTLGWRLRKTQTGGGTTVVMNIHSILCYQVCPTSGV